jgi:hypothetical protein
LKAPDSLLPSRGLLRYGRRGTAIAYIPSLSAARLLSFVPFCITPVFSSFIFRADLRGVACAIMAESGMARQNWVVGVSTALTVISGKTSFVAFDVMRAYMLLAVVIVCLRVYTRAIILHNMGKDDYAMITALLFTLGYLATIYVLRANKMGFHLSEVSFEQATTSLKVTYAIESIYYVCVNTIKVSIVCFYLRIGTDYLRSSVLCEWADGMK